MVVLSLKMILSMQSVDLGIIQQDHVTGKHKHHLGSTNERGIRGPYTYEFEEMLW